MQGTLKNLPPRRKQRGVGDRREAQQGHDCGGLPRLSRIPPAALEHKEDLGAWAVVPLSQPASPWCVQASWGQQGRW